MAKEERGGFYGLLAPLPKCTPGAVRKAPQRSSGRGGGGGGGGKRIAPPPRPRPHPRPPPLIALSPQVWPPPRPPAGTWAHCTRSRPPSASARPRLLPHPTSSPEKSNLAPGEEAAAPAAARPAAPAPAPEARTGPRIGVSAPQQVARDARCQPGNLSPRRRGAPRAASLPRGGGAGLPGHPLPLLLPPCPMTLRGRAGPGLASTCRATPGPAETAGLLFSRRSKFVPSSALQLFPPPPHPASDNPFAGKWFYSGAGSWGRGCRPGQWNVKNGQPSFFFFSLFFFPETKTKVPSYSLARRNLEAGGRLRETGAAEFEESHLQTVSAEP